MNMFDDLLWFSQGAVQALGVVDDSVLYLLQDDNVIRKYDAWLKK